MLKKQIKLLEIYFYEYTNDFIKIIIKIKNMQGEGFEPSSTEYK